MTPKEKAEELVLKFKELPEEGTLMWYLSFEIAKKCALIAVDEILNILNDYWNQDCKINHTKIGYYEEVKQEIEKL
jgi:hypothetical protein